MTRRNVIPLAQAQLKYLREVARAAGLAGDFLDFIEGRDNSPLARRRVLDKLAVMGFTGVDITNPDWIVGVKAK